jgi:hypothetical protein
MAFAGLIGRPAAAARLRDLSREPRPAMKINRDSSGTLDNYPENLVTDSSPGTTTAPASVGPGPSSISLSFAPLLAWATAWSFDRLRLWLERGASPSATLRHFVAHACARSTVALVFAYHGLVPTLLMRRWTCAIAHGVACSVTVGVSQWSGYRWREAGCRLTSSRSGRIAASSDRSSVSRQGKFAFRSRRRHSPGGGLRRSLVIIHLNPERQVLRA